MCLGRRWARRSGGLKGLHAWGAPWCARSRYLLRHSCEQRTSWVKLLVQTAPTQALSLLSLTRQQVDLFAQSERFEYLFHVDVGHCAMVIPFGCRRFSVQRSTDFSRGPSASYSSGRTGGSRRIVTLQIKSDQSDKVRNATLGFTEVERQRCRNQRGGGRRLNKYGRVSVLLGRARLC